MSCDSRQASRQPSPARPCGCVRLRGSTSCRRRKRSSPAPVRPKGAPPWASGPSADSRFAARPPWPSGFGRCSRPYPVRPRFAWTRPERGPAQALLCLRDAPDDRCAATGPSLRQAVISCCPVPADFAMLRLPVPGRCGRLRDRKTSGRSSRPRKHDAELRAIGRQTLRADCLGPPAFSPFARSRSGPAS